MSSKEDIETIQILVEEIIKAIRKISNNSNNLMIKQGNIISKTGDGPWDYKVKIDGEQYSIKSHIGTFDTGKIVNVLCSVNGTIKVLLG